MPASGDSSVRRKLMRLSMLASLIPLVFASGAFVVYDLVTFRDTLQQRLDTDADIIGLNSVSALLFNDEKEAAENLQALTTAPHVLSGAIYDRNGKRYASWSRDPSDLLPSQLPSSGLPEQRDRVMVSRRIVDEGPIGTIVLKADLGERSERLRRYVIIVVLVSLASFLLAIPITTRLQRTISAPILGLAETARRISRDKDYSIRAREEGRDEIGQFQATFNEMLEQIQLRDVELKEGRSSLEQRVQERTSELQLELAERRKAEEALRKSELMLAEAQRLAHVGSWEWDAREDRLIWSEELYRIYGVSPAMLKTTYEGFLDRVHPEDRERVDEAVMRAAREGAPFSLDHRIVRPDGEVRTLHAFGNAVLDAERTLVRMVGTGQDVTDRKKVEEERETLIRAQAARAEAEAAERRAALLAEISSEVTTSLHVESSLPRVVRLAVPEFADWCSIHLVDGPRVRLVAVADADPRMEKLAWEIEARYPMRMSEISRTTRAINEGRPDLLTEITPDDLRTAAKDETHHSLLQMLAFRSAMMVPLAARGPSFGIVSFGSRTEGRSYGRLDLSVAENIAGRVAVAIDNGRLYREAQEANRIKDEFLATLSHELRTPLNAIVGWARMLRSGELDRETATRAIETIDRNALVQAQLIEDILDVSRIVAGKLQLDVQPVDLAAVVDAALDSVRPAAAAKELRLQRVIDPSAGPVTGDPARLQQVVWNLLSNAIKFTPKGGRVQVRLARVNSHAEIVVEDTGAGIEPEFLPHVFERFLQADSSSTRSHGGLGLGLAIVRHLIELHGGSVEAESGGLGQGATFRVKLPLRAIARPTEPLTLSPDMPSTEPSTIQSGLAGVSILLVDDEPDTRELLTMVLERHGARVISTASAAEALVMLEKERPDLLISDIEMPGCDGYELMRRIRALPPSRGGLIPAAALTAYARSEDRLKALLAGFNIHVAKPVQPAELAAVAASLTGRSAGSGGRQR